MSGDGRHGSHSKISRIETAKTPVTSGDVRHMLAHYEIASAEAEGFVTLAREAKQCGAETIETGTGYSA